MTGMGRQKTKKSSQISIDKKSVWMFLLSAVLVLAAGFICEYACNMKVLSLPRAQRGIIPVVEGNVRAEGFVKTEKGWELADDKGILTVELGGWYIDKLAYSYEYNHLLNAKAYVCYYNEYGEAECRSRT